MLALTNTDQKFHIDINTKYSPLEYSVCLIFNKLSQKIELSSLVFSSFKSRGNLNELIVYPYTGEYPSVFAR